MQNNQPTLDGVISQAIDAHINEIRSNPPVQKLFAALNAVYNGTSNVPAECTPNVHEICSAVANKSLAVPHAVYLQKTSDPTRRVKLDINEKTANAILNHGVFAVYKGQATVTSPVDLCCELIIWLNSSGSSEIFSQRMQAFLSAQYGFNVFGQLSRYELVHTALNTRKREMSSTQTQPPQKSHQPHLMQSTDMLTSSMSDIPRAVSINNTTNNTAAGDFTQNVYTKCRQICINPSTENNPQSPTFDFKYYRISHDQQGKMIVDIDNSMPQQAILVDHQTAKYILAHGISYLLAQQTQPNNNNIRLPIVSSLEDLDYEIKLLQHKIDMLKQIRRIISAENVMDQLVREFPNFNVDVGKARQSIIGLCSIYIALLSGKLQLNQTSTILNEIQNVGLKNKLVQGGFSTQLDTKYLIIDPNCTEYLGAGAYGITFKVVCAFTGVSYAIKYAQESGDPTKQREGSVCDEFQIIAAYSTLPPFITRPYGTFKTQFNSLIIILEYLPTSDVQKKSELIEKLAGKNDWDKHQYIPTAQNLFTKEQVISLLMQILVGVKDIQQYGGYIHRDIKQSNILLCRAGDLFDIYDPNYERRNQLYHKFGDDTLICKLIDYGMMKDIESSNNTQNTNGSSSNLEHTNIGNKMSKDVNLSKGKASRETDLYGFAMVALMWLFGFNPAIDFMIQRINSMQTDGMCLEDTEVIQAVKRIATSIDHYIFLYQQQINDLYNSIPQAQSQPLQYYDRTHLITNDPEFHEALNYLVSPGLEKRKKVWETPFYKKHEPKTRKLLQDYQNTCYAIGRY